MPQASHLLCYILGIFLHGWFAHAYERNQIISITLCLIAAGIAGIIMGRLDKNLEKRKHHDQKIQT